MMIVERKTLRVRRSYHESGHAVAALQLGIPVISISIANGRPHLLRGHYSAPDIVALESLGIMCMAGPASEELFCGPIKDGGDTGDLSMLAEYLMRHGYEMRRAIGEIARFKSAADRLVRTPSVKNRIRLIATELMRCGSMTGEQIAALA